MKRIKRNKLTSVERDAELRARVRGIIREISFPREFAEGLDPREPLPPSIPVRFDRP